MAIDPLACDGNGEILVQSVVDKINELITANEAMEVCCTEVNARSYINTLRVGSKLYITDDGSIPVEI